MADNTVKVRLQSAYKTSADWDTLNPVLKNGEVGYVSSPASMYGWYKIGNGTSTWKQLSYSTYRPLNNGDFDTINVTDETAGNLIVTGAARFTNVIQGTASSASNAAKVDGTLTITQDGTTKLNAWNGSAATSIALTDNNDTYKFATSTSGVTTAIAGLRANGASTFDTNSSANLATTAFVNPLINALGTGSSLMTTSDYIITSWVGASSPTTTWHRRQAKFVAVGTAEIAKKTAGTLTLQTAGVTKATFNGNTTTFNVTTSDLGIGTAGVMSSSSFMPSTIKYGASLGTASNKLQLKDQDGNNLSDVTIPFATNASQLGGTVASSYATKDYVTTEIAKLGQPMHYKGIVTTASGLPASPAIGDTYKVAEAGTYSSTAAKVGDMFIYSSDGWQYIPSADEDAVMSVAADETYVTTVGSQSASAVKLSHLEQDYTFDTTAKYGSSAYVPIITIDKAGHIAAITTVAVKDNNSNYYTTAVNCATTTDGVAVWVKGNHANVKGTAVIPPASSASFGVIKGSGNLADFLDGACTWRGLTTSDVTDFNAAVVATKVDNAVNADTVNNLTVQTAVPANAVFTDTKNTAGATNSDSKLFLIGATAQDANPQTYSDSEVYTTNGTLTTNKVQVGGTAVTLQFNSTTKSLDFVFA